MTKLGLTINEAKTSLRNARQERFDFLGYRSARIGLRRTGNGIWARARPRRVCNGSRQGVGDLLVPSNIDPWPEVHNKLNRSLRGLSDYFGYGSRCKASRSIDEYVIERVRRFLVRRHKVQGHRNRRFTFDVIHRELGVLCLQRLPELPRRVPHSEASRKAGCRKQAPSRFDEAGMGNEAIAGGPEASAPILNSTATDIRWGIPVESIGPLASRSNKRDGLSVAEVLTRDIR